MFFKPDSFINGIFLPVLEAYHEFHIRFIKDIADPEKAFDVNYAKTLLFPYGA